MTPPGAEDIDDTGDLLQSALELAFVQARRDAGSHDAPPPPAALRPVLRFTRLPGRALKTVRAVLDADEAFRSRVAASAREDEVGRASWLFLTRPDGWEEELELLSAAAREQEEGRRQSREEQRAERRAAQLDDTVARLREELAELRGELAEAERSAEDDRSARQAAEVERDALSGRVEALEAERSRAVRSLKDTEATAVDRLQELRRLQARVDQLTEEREAAADGRSPAESAAEPAPAPEPPGPPSPWEGRDPDAVAAAVQQAAVAAGALAEALARAADALGAPEHDLPSAPPVESPAPPATPQRAGKVRPPRRTPVRLRQGLHEDSSEGLEQLVRTPGMVVVVDGYNVAKEGWPSLDVTAQRDSMVAALGVLRSRTGAEVHVVFDGDATGDRPSVGAPLPVRVHFSPAEVEADDVILQMVAELPTDVPVLVVSSDRRVADGARRLGANAAPSARLLQLVRR